MEDAYVLEPGFAEGIGRPSAPAQGAGHRQHNSAVHGLPRSNPTNYGGFFAIYDGHGGRECAEAAQKLLHRELEKTLLSLEPQAAIEAAFLKTDDAMKRFHECGCTAVIAFLQVHENGSRTLYVANTGDAQAFLVSEQPPQTHPISNISSPGSKIGKNSTKDLITIPLSYDHAHTLTQKHSHGLKHDL